MASSTSTTSSIHGNIVPSEVGWQFVPQYYTYMNKQPNRLHCFYTKNSTFIHGTEGEDIKPCYGQQEIHNKILSIGFTDCKVFIHSVDAQSSSNGGIIIQVIGDMSNNNEAWRKFAQTFFLAEQPNGYFVLNDIFRYLKEEPVEVDEAEAKPAANVEPESEPAPSDTPPVAPLTVEPQPAIIEDSITVAEDVHSVIDLPNVNGFHTPVEHESAETTAIPVAVELVVSESVKESTPEQIASVAEPETSKVVRTVMEAVAVTPPEPVAEVPPPAAVAPSQPPPPKTWANLAAANSNRWGNAVAQEAKGVSAAAAPFSSLPSGASTPRDGHATPGRGPRGDRGERESHTPINAAAIAITTPQCFVKGVTEVVSHELLASTLSARFGPVEVVDIVRPKACAFLKFANLESAKRAIIASLPMNQGGEGGIRIDVGETGQVRISVETRKERGERPPPRGRGGAPANGDLRGGFRGGRGGVGGGGGRVVVPPNGGSK